VEKKGNMYALIYYIFIKRYSLLTLPQIKLS